MRSNGSVIQEYALSPSAHLVWRVDHNPALWIISPPTDPVLFDVSPDIELHVIYRRFYGGGGETRERVIRGVESFDRPLTRTCPTSSNS
jgi:hypothetical protein